MASSPNTVYYAILAKTARQKEFYQGIEDAWDKRARAVTESALIDAVAFAATRAYQRYHAARP
jgi:hypothetical protein